jgi:hypothetical protein
MPPFEPLLVVFAAILLLHLFARALLMRHPIAFSALFLASGLAALLLGSPHVFFYGSLLLAIGTEIQLADDGARGVFNRFMVPMVVAAWGVVWFGFPSDYVNTSKWVALLTFIIFFIAGLRTRLPVHTEPRFES